MGVLEKKCLVSFKDILSGNDKSFWKKVLSTTINICYVTLIVNYYSNTCMGVGKGATRRIVQLQSFRKYSCF